MSLIKKVLERLKANEVILEEVVDAVKKRTIAPKDLEKLKPQQLSGLMIGLFNELVDSGKLMKDCVDQIETLQIKAMKNYEEALDKVETMAAAIDKAADAVDKVKSYADAASVSATLVRINQGGKIIPSITKRKPAKAECIRVVTRPKDVNIKSSRDIRREFNKKYKDVVLEKCYATSGGSIFLEVESKEKAGELDADWDNTLFGGNNGLRDSSLDNAIGVIKNVVNLDEDLSMSEIETALRSNLELAMNSNVEFFKRKNSRTGTEEFSGTIKVVFKDSHTLQQAITNKIFIGDMRYSVEKWEHRVKVKYCYKCLKFGHVSYRCRSAKSKCGKCAFEGHEQKDCTVTNPQLLKCGHCGGKHKTGSYSCKSMREQVDMLNSRVTF